MSKKMTKSNTIIWKDKKDYDALKTEAKKQERSINWYVVQAVKEKVERDKLEK